MSICGNYPLSIQIQDIDHNMLSKMNLLDMCCSESLRKYPPAIRWVTGITEADQKSHPSCQNHVISYQTALSGPTVKSDKQCTPADSTWCLSSRTFFVLWCDSFTFRLRFFHFYRTERECNGATTLKGIDIQEGVLVVIPIRAIHYDPKIWPEPDKFDPYRFTPEQKAKHGPYDWIPFGSGPRNCVAMRLALVEFKIAVAYLVREYRFIRSDKTEVKIPTFLSWRKTCLPNLKSQNAIRDEKSARFQVCLTNGKA